MGSKWKYKKIATLSNLEQPLLRFSPQITQNLELLFIFDKFQRIQKIPWKYQGNKAMEK